MVDIGRLTVLFGRLRIFVGAFVLLTIVLVYGYCLGVTGVYPPSHPWSGISLTILSVTWIRKSRRPLPAEVHLCASGLLVLSAGLWALGAFLL